MIEIHKNLGITDENFNTFKNHMKVILEDMNLESTLVSGVLNAMENQRPLIVFGKKKE